MTNTTTFAIQMVNMADGTTAGHKAGCSDLKKLAQRHEVLDVEHYATKYDAWLDYNYDFIAEGGADSAWPIDWKACANHIPAGEPEADPEAAFMAAESDFEARRAERKADKDMRSNRATKEDSDAAQKPMTRKQAIARLAELGYTGPTSYLMPKVRQIVADLELAAA